MSPAQVRFAWWLVRSLVEGECSSRGMRPRLLHYHDTNQSQYVNAMRVDHLPQTPLGASGTLLGLPLFYQRLLPM
jgi:hypothetical protein